MLRRGNTGRQGSGSAELGTNVPRMGAHGRMRGGGGPVTLTRWTTSLA
jgi:hypothetical protein